MLVSMQDYLGFVKLCSSDKSTQMDESRTNILLFMKPFQFVD